MRLKEIQKLLISPDGSGILFLVAEALEVTKKRYSGQQELRIKNACSLASNHSKPKQDSDCISKI